MRNWLTPASGKQIAQEVETTLAAYDADCRRDPTRESSRTRNGDPFSRAYAEAVRKQADLMGDLIRDEDHFAEPLTNDQRVALQSAEITAYSQEVSARQVTQEIKSLRETLTGLQRYANSCAEAQTTAIKEAGKEIRSGVMWGAFIIAATIGMNISFERKQAQAAPQPQTIAVPEGAATAAGAAAAAAALTTAPAAPVAN